MLKQLCLYAVLLLVLLSAQRCWVSSGGAPSDTIGTATGNRFNAHVAAEAQQQAAHHAGQQHPYAHNTAGSAQYHAAATAGSGSHQDNRNSYNLLSEAMSQAVSNEFSSLVSGSADGACPAEDLECYSGNMQDRLGMEAIRTLHRQLDDDDNGNIDLSESDDFLREELKYDSGYEKRQKVFHFNDDMHISVKELWEAWLRSEVHNWTIEQTTDWLAQSVQLPQYVELFKLHKVTGAALPRLAVNNMHYVSNVLGIKDPIHKQKIALKAMDVVLFGPPRETGTRWKDYILVTLLLSAIIGCWYAYQQNKNAKRHLRRMAQDMEGLQRAEQSLQEMQKELERARMEQENVATEKMDLERRLKEAPSLTSSSSDLEVQQLKKEIEILRSELSRAEIELVDNCWAPPPQLQSWLQYTYELESKNHMKKRVSAEKQLQSAREACEKLRKKRSSLVGAFVSTHGKSIDDVDRSIVEARNSLGEVTNELQERLHRWKQIENCLGFHIVNNNGLSYLESVLYGRNGGILKGSRGRMTNSTDDLDDESVQGMFDSYSRSSASMSGGHGGGSSGLISSASNTIRDDSSCSDDGAETQSVQFYLGNAPTPPASAMTASRTAPPSLSASVHASYFPPALEAANMNHAGSNSLTASVPSTPCAVSACAANTALPLSPPLPPHSNAHTTFTLSDSQMLRSQSTDLVPMEIYSFLAGRPHAPRPGGIVGQQLLSGVGVGGAAATHNNNSHNAVHNGGGTVKKMVKQHSSASQQSTSSTSSSVQSVPAAGDGGMAKGQSPGRWSSYERIVPVHEHQQLLLHQHQQQHHQSQPQRQHAADKEPLLQPHHAAATAAATTPISAAAAQRMSGSLSLQSVCFKPQHDHGADVDGTSAAASATAAAAPHGDTQLEDQLLLPAAAAVAADSASLDGSLKKRKRRLRFPFGGGSGKKSSSASKSKLT